MHAQPSTHRTPLRDSIAELMLGTANDDLLAELRRLVAGTETRADRLLARYRGRPAGGRI